MKRFLALLISTISIAACGGSSSSDTTFKTSNDVLAAMTAAGFSCTQYTPTAKADRELGQESANEVGGCELEGESIDITLWKDSGQLKNWEGMGKSIGCKMGEAFGITEFDYLKGDAWSVSGTSKTLTEKLAARIGGDAIHIKC
jgi:hypothetical protein